MSSLPALASTLIGVLAGIELLKQKAGWLEWTFITGASCLATGLLWSHWFPLNKRLWTSSFVLVNAGISLIALGLLRWWLDGHSDRGRALTPFRIFRHQCARCVCFLGFSGCLPLVGCGCPHAGVTLGRWLFHPVPHFIPNRYFAGLVCAVFYIGVCFLPVWLLYRKRIFLKV